MSYYNEMFYPIKTQPEDLSDEGFMIFFSTEPNFDHMVKLIGEDFVQKVTIDFTEKMMVVFKAVNGGTDAIRPSMLDWQWNGNKTFYSFPDCFIFVHDMHNRINWADCNSEEMERALPFYQKHVKKYGEKLVIFPL